MISASLASVAIGTQTAEAMRGPAYSGPITTADGPAYFGPAPNPFPYCESPTYLDPFPENVNPIGRMDIGDSASVTTDGITMDLVITAEGNPGEQYPGFFPNGGDGGSNDRAKGIELAEGDGATVNLSEPLFYSQWIFTDVDQPNEGFTVTPKWTVPGQAAAFGGDTEFTFAGSTNQAVELDDLNGESEVSESINGRVQVDFLGAVTGIDMLRTFPSNGQSGFAVGGGCEAAGAAKAVIDGPTWTPAANSAGGYYDVTYELRMRNNLPSSATIQAVINDAVGQVGASLVTGTPQGIILNDLQLTDDLRDPAFSNIEVTSLTTTGGLNLNQSFDGQTDFELINSGVIEAESNEVITLSVRYTPDLAQGSWGDCQVGYTYLNQTVVTGSAANVGVSDASDNGFSAAPSDNNGEGGVDDPTPVLFDCPPGELEIVKTVIPGPQGDCPAFDGGVQGPGTPLPVTVDETATYCISVRNIGPGPVWDVSVSDPQAPGGGTFTLPNLNVGEEASVSYDLVISDATPRENVATATATDATGPVGPVNDNALIDVLAKPLPVLEIVKTVLAGANTPCPAFDGGVAGLGPALEVFDGESVTYCISVRNIGPGAATNVVISDPQAPQAYTIGTLLTNEEASASYTLAVTPGTEPINVATANYNGPDGPLSPVDDDAQILVKPLEPGLAIVKTVLPGANATCPAFDDGVPGLGTALQVNDRDVVTYCISVRNTGLGIATDVSVSDPQAGSPSTFPIGTLISGQEETVQFNLTASLTTEEVNTATASGNGPSGPLDDVTDQAQIIVDALPNPGIEIVKTAIASGDCPSFENGTQGVGTPVPFLETETVTYCITVRNVGPGPATDVVISDPQAPNTFDMNIGDLGVGDSVTRSYQVPNLTVNSETENVATATGNGLNGPIDPVSDPAEIVVTPQPDPILEIVKTVLPGADADCPDTFDGGTLGDGTPLPVLYTESVTFCITVRNVGGNPATAVTVTDDQSPGVLQLGTINVGEEASGQYNVVVDADTEDTNTASATGQGPNGLVGPVSDTAVIAPSPQPDPILQIVKTVVGPGESCPANFDAGTQGPGDPLPVLYDDTITYCITVRNVGLNPATNVVVTDPQAGDPFVIGDLGVGQEADVSYQLIIDADSEDTNTATATGEGPNGPVGPVSDTALIDPSPQPNPVLEIVKTVVGPGADCPATFLDGTPGDGDALVVEYGTTITYCVSVRNVAGTPATNVVVTDPQADAPIELDTIGVGEEKSTSYTVDVGPNTPLTNTATATGEGPNGALSPVRDTAIIEPAPAVLEIVKTALAGSGVACPAFADGVAGPGTPVARMYTEVVTYCITIKNTGGNPATGVVISDDQAPAPGTFDIGTLDPGEEVTRSYEVTVDADTDETNIAKVNGTGPDGEPVPEAEDPAVISTSPLPDPVLEIVKTAVAGQDADCPAFDAGTPGLGDAVEINLDEYVTYCVSIRNTGDGDATDVKIEDDQAVDAPFIIGDLPAGASADVKYSVKIGLNPELVNTAVVTGTGPNSDPGGLTAEDPSLIELIDTRVTSIALIHSVSKTEECITAAKNLNSLVADIEDLPITWCAKITNTGNVALANVTLVAPNIGFPDGLDVLEGTGKTVLEPTEDIYVAFAGTIPDTGVISAAEATGDPAESDGTLITDLAPPTDDDNANVLEASINIESTVVLGPDGDCADSVEMAIVPVGADVTWCYTVSNTGSTVLRVTEVTDTVLGITIPVPEGNRRLGLNDVFVVSEDTVATEPVTNDGDVKGKPLGFNDEELDAPEVDDHDPASIEMPGADLSIDKSNSNGGPVAPGSELTYTLVITNKGPDSASDVTVRDSLPTGLLYLSIPTAEGWVCALDTGERGFTCLKSQDMAADASETLTYRVRASGGGAAFNSALTNTAQVTSSTPDPNPDDNIDTSTTSIFPPDEIIPTTQLPYPGPFETPEPPAEEPDEVLGLVVTGAATNLLGLIAAAMLALGGMFTVGARRSREDEL